MAALEIWTWIPNEVALPEEPNVRQISYGDGYRARIAQGENSLLPTFSLRYTDADPYAVEQMRTFLIARNAVEKFSYLAPDGTWRKVVCPKWNTNYKAGKADFTCDFYEVKEP